MKEWECTICGYIHQGDEPPDKCPVCGADKDKFIEKSKPPEEKIPDTTLTSPGTDTLLSKMTDMMLQKHLHPIAVHTPNGIVPAAVIFLLLALTFNNRNLESAAFYNMVFVLLAMPVVLFSGFLEWRKHYNGIKTTMFLTKITCSTITLAAILVIVIWRWINPEIASPESPNHWIYFTLHLVALCAVGLAGHIGGKLVFGRRKK